ncbi:hypothetical protein JCM11251_007983 [Rhodosporidiobolus azoricus]
MSAASLPPAIERRTFYRTTAWQLGVVCIVSFVAPGLWNGANSLGAGGALEPYLVNAGNSIVFAVMGLGCIFAPIIVNKLGVKYTLILGTVGWSVYTASLYQNNRYGTEWFVILGAVICGASAGLYWASEGAIVLAYPEPSKRGKYLAAWLASKNSGQLLAGIINLATNINRSTGGKVNYSTLICFIALQVAGIPISFLVSNADKVQRKDRTKIVIPNQTSTKEQFSLLWKTVSSAKVGLLLPVFFTSWFYWGFGSSFLTLYFSVRARALASLLSAVCGVLVGILFGFFLDNQRLSLQFRARVGAAVSFTLFSGMLIWSLVVQKEFSDNNPGKLDWTDKTGRFGKGFGMYVMLNAIGNGVQNYLYWLMGTLAQNLAEATRYAGLLRGIESWGQCAAFGINSSKFNPFYTVIINCVFFWVSIPTALLTIRKVGYVEGYGIPATSDSSPSAASSIVDGEEEEKKEEERDVEVEAKKVEV